MNKQRSQRFRGFKEKTEVDPDGLQEPSHIQSEQMYIVLLKNVSQKIQDSTMILTRDIRQIGNIVIYYFPYDFLYFSAE